MNKPYIALLILLLFSSCSKTIAFKNNETLDANTETNEVASAGLKEYSLLSASEAKQRIYAEEQLVTKPKQQKKIKVLKTIAAVHKINKLLKNKSISIKAENKKTAVTKSIVGGILKIILGLALIFLGLVFAILGVYGIFLLIIIGASSWVFVLLLLGLLAIILGIVLLVKGIKNLAE